MRKEIIFAVIFGIVFGTIVSLGFLRANRAIKDTANNIITKNNDVSEIKTSEQKNLTLIKPQNYQVIIDNPVTFSGLTGEGSYIVISNGENEEFSKTEDGSFEIKFDLNPALNNISISSISETGDIQKTSMELIYSSEFSKQINGNAEDESVDDRLEKAEKSYTFYKGIVTDIANGSVQMKSDGQEIKYLSIDENVSTFSKLSEKTQNIKYSDLAIGDYILALGYIDEKDVLTTLRVLVTSVENPSESSIILGMVEDVSKSTINVKSVDEKAYELASAKTSKYSDGDINDPDKALFSDLEAGCEVLLTYQQDGESLNIKKLHIISYPEASLENN